MFDFYLPSREQFIQIIKKNEIKEWQAKEFWSYFDIKANSDPIFLRQKMYAGLKILHRQGFLMVKYSPNNSRLFLYSETAELQKFRDMLFINDYENIFTKEREKLNLNLEKNNNMEILIDELSVTYPELRDRLLMVKNEIKSKRISQEMKLQNLHDLLQILF
jgi:hypothetical protein